jgi:hypothetical protein
MYLINSDKVFELDAIKSLLLKNHLLFTDDFNENFFGEIKLTYEKTFIKISYDQNSYSCKLPLSFHNFFDKLFKLLLSQKINFGFLHYSPLGQELSSINKKIKLTDTHNIMIAEIIKNQYSGLHKNKLYRSIWPKDFEIQTGKLDTHLTNLKKLLKKEFNFELIYKSSNGLLSFQID